MQREMTTPSGPSTTDLGIGGMTCASCVARVERAIARMPEVASVSVNLATESARVVWVSDDVANGVPHETADETALLAKLKRTVRDAGYEPLSPAHLQDQADHPWAGFAPVALGLLLSLPLMLPMLGDLLGLHWMLSPWQHFVLATPVQFVLGARFYKAGWHAARALSGNMDLLVALGTSAGWALSVWLWWTAPAGAMVHLYFEGSAVVITLVLLGKWLEARAKRQTTDAIRALHALRPTQARVIGSDGEMLIPVDELLVDDLVVVLPGERLPADGVLTEGETQIDESMLTGEPLPVFKALGARVTGGSVNGESRVVLRVTATGTQTVLAHIIRLVEDAQAAKAPIQLLVDKVASVFVPVVLLLALLTGLAWWFTGHGVEQALIHSVAVLVIACPCALGLATPVAIMAGTGVAARHGILIKDAHALETAHRVRTIAFDKTGTLTQGRPKLLQCVPMGDASHDTCLQWAACVQAASEHPLAQAVLRAAEQAHLTWHAPSVSEAVSGKGVRAQLEGQTLLLGSVAWLREWSTRDAAWLARAQALQNEGATVSVLAQAGEETSDESIGESSGEASAKVLALLVFGDEPKPEAAAALTQLRNLGLSLMMISGDNQGAARAMAKRLGLRDDEVLAEVLPADKAQWVTRLRANLNGHGAVAFVGDGINDAPALAAADVGMAMANADGGGTDVAMQAAGITLMRGDVALVAAAIDVSRRTVSKIRQNLFWAFAYNVAGIPLAAMGYLSPVVAGAAMALSSVSVMANALLLRRWRMSTNAVLSKTDL
ncbi:MAG: Copper-exporting P-type ATPase [Pseudomonadota bacterium]